MKWNQSREEEFWRTVIFLKSNRTDNSSILTSELPYLFEPVIWKDLDSEGYLKVFACLFIIIGGLLGNIGVILTVLSTKNLCKTINYFMVNLAIADAMICIFCIAPYAINIMTENVFIFGNFMCKFNSYIQMTCLICSVLTLSAMSYNRFKAIMFPLHAKNKNFRISVLLTVIWIVSMVLALPLPILKSTSVIQWRDFNETVCSEDWPTDYNHLRLPYYLTICIALFFVPAAILTISNLLVVYTLCTSKIPGTCGTKEEISRSNTNRRTTMMVLIMLIVFISCWTPMIVTYLYGLWAKEKITLPSWFQEFQWFSFYMAYANSFMNPIIYGFFNKTFRENFSSLFCCDAQRKRLQDSVRSRFTYKTSLISNLSRRL